MADAGIGALLGRRVVDLTMPFSSEITPVPGHPRAAVAPWHVHEVQQRSNSVMFFSIHTGTHVDAPYHFHPDAATIDRIPPDRFIRPAVLCGLRARARPGQPMRVDALRVGLDGAELEDRIAVLWSGWADRNWNTPRLYADNPFLDPAAAEWLAARRIAALGLDFAVDPGPPLPCHLVLLGGAGIPLIENLVHLDQVGQRYFLMIPLPHKVQGGNGGQARVVALV
jgi:kynurenine formamidase